VGQPRPERCSSMAHRGEEHSPNWLCCRSLSTDPPETGHQVLTTKAQACEPYGDCSHSRHRRISASRPNGDGAAMKDQAWLDGQKNGRIDRFRGTRNEHAWIVLLNEGYSRNYSLGYRHGWTRPNEGPL
jgi:hypothetical protein